MNVSPLFIFILGVLIGFLLALYVLGTAPKENLSETSTTQTLDDLLRIQIGYQQSQNMLRELQLQQRRQEAAFESLESERSKLLASTQRLNHADIRAYLEDMANRGHS